MKKKRQSPLRPQEPEVNKTQPIEKRQSPPAAEFPNVAIFWVPEAYTLSPKLIMGRQSAGAGFLRAVVSAKPRHLFCYAKSREEAEEFKHTIHENGAPDTAISWIPLLRPKGLRQAGLLYRPDANIASDGWRRAAQGDDRAYSICGVTHTTATQAIMEGIASLVTAPLYSWDALVCTSHSVRDSVRSVLEAAGEHLRERLGATRITLPQLPLIPLGVDCSDYVFSHETRVQARQALRIAPDEVVVSYVGRLSFHGKAHPVPMYIAIEQAAHDNRVVLLQAGWFPDKAIESTFQKEAALFCPSVRCIFADGRDPKIREQVWAASDVFTSLVDNFQETFGLSPIEAMAAGLPSVISDWNGYRDTIRDGIDGFRVPTLSMPSGTGGDIADRYDWGIDSYDFYTFHASQLVSIDVDAAAEGYRRLISDRELRAQMGQSARQRALAYFDWPLVRERYVALWEELRERRRADPVFHVGQVPRRRPDRADPFTMFATYPTHVIGPKTEIQRRSDCTLEQALARLKLDSTGKATAVLPSPELTKEILSAVPEDGWLSFDKLHQLCSGHEPVALARAVIWLSKFGVVRSRMPGEQGR